METEQAPLVAKSKSVAGWIFGGLSFIPLAGVLFGLIAIVIGLTKKSKGVVFLGLGGILVTVAIFGGFYYLSSLPKTGVVKIAVKFINEDADIISLYKQQNGKLPAKLSDLGNVSPENGFFPVDPWGTEIFYSTKGTNQFELRSAGPDKVFNTEDDIAKTF